MESYKKMWQNALNTSDRTRRKDYWGAMGMNILVLFVLGSIMTLFMDTSLEELMTVLLAIYVLVVMVPTTTMAIRRLHDIGKSGWWVLWCTLLNCLFFIGGIVYIVFMCSDSVEDNEWGPNPKNDSIA